MERIWNRLHNSPQFSVDLVIPEPQDAIATTAQMDVPLSVTVLLSREAMLTTVDFDNQL
jgi:hypothetical protein